MRPTSLLRKYEEPEAPAIHPIWVARFEVTGPRDHPWMESHPAATVWAAARAEDGAALKAKVESALEGNGIRVVHADTPKLHDGDAEFSQEVQTIIGEASRTVDSVAFGKFHGYENRAHRPPPFLELKTERLLLRPWHRSDREAFAAMNADREVMTYFPGPMSRRQSDKAMDRYLADFDRYGFSFLVAELRETRAFAGIIGMQVMHDIIPNVAQPAFELGWRLNREYWGRGLATEGARAVVDLAFHHFRFDEVVAITAVENKASRHVMDKLGMTHRGDLDFDHPRMPPQHLYARHTLYQLKNPWIQE